ncbi:hypothetical protein BDV95DRAFT_602979 [Massariosphaeria phaeospora]|uniref:Uncharacterized protein n=1 Tax=Massariosphaeria phaeospora TaxID=100035 RepID=A0A7C8MAM5_9PLEO|nr:hypothetical protein BDV95DRAFT_602979 [Massariosphaeria phaeospora]
MRDIAQTDFSPSLKTLIIWRCDVSAVTLIAFLLKFRRTLSTLVIDYVPLHGNWRDVVVTLWDGFPRLKNITLRMVHEHALPVSFNRLRDNRHLPAPFEKESFELADPDRDGWLETAAVRYKGEHMWTALDALSRLMWSAAQHSGGVYHEGELEDFSSEERRR